MARVFRPFGGDDATGYFGALAYSHDGYGGTVVRQQRRSHPITNLLQTEAYTLYRIFKDLYNLFGKWGMIWEQSNPIRFQNVRSAWLNNTNELATRAPRSFGRYPFRDDDGNLLQCDPNFFTTYPYTTNHCKSVVWNRLEGGSLSYFNDWFEIFLGPCYCRWRYTSAQWKDLEPHISPEKWISKLHNAITFPPFEDPFTGDLVLDRQLTYHIWACIFSLNVADEFPDPIAHTGNLSRLDRPFFNPPGFRVPPLPGELRYPITTLRIPKPGV